MSTEAPGAPITETDLLIFLITSIMDETAAKTEIDRLRDLRNEVFTLDVYYNLLSVTYGKRAPSTQIALGKLYTKVREFASRLGKLGLNPTQYATTTSVLALFPSPRGSRP